MISLGSPYRMIDGDHSNAERKWERVRHLHGVAPWHTFIDADGERCENIEVRGSHIGMAVNPAVVVAVLDRLAQPTGAWKPFAPPLAMRSWYPRPRRWHAERPRRTA